LKTREDIRVLEDGRQGTPESRATRLSFFGTEGLLFAEERASAVKNSVKKGTKYSRIVRLCPLTIAAKEGPMVNNMVLSREIEWIGYEHKRNMLQVEFIVGSIYQYENVPETVYQEFLTAPSHGRFFESNIKNKYQVRKIR
jgi:hypothetical protein